MTDLTCISCGRHYKKSKGRYYCEDCGSIMGTLVVDYDFTGMEITRDMFSPTASIYQFEKLLPVKNHSKTVPFFIYLLQICKKCFKYNK